MPAFAETYSAAQRAALFHAAIDDKMPVRAVLDAAGRGELPGLDAADQRVLAGMAYGYACQLVRDEKLERGGVERVRAQPDKIARDIAIRVLKRAERDIAEIERRAGKRPLKLDESRQVEHAQKRVRDAMALVRELDGTGKQATAEKTREPERPRSLVARIAAQSKTEAGDTHTPTDADASNAAARANTSNGETTGAGGGPVRLRAASSAPVDAGV